MKRLLTLSALALLATLLIHPVTTKAADTTETTNQFNKHFAEDFYKSDGLTAYLKDKTSFSSITPSELDTYESTYSTSITYYEATCANVETDFIPVCNHAKEAATKLAASIAEMKTEATFKTGLDNTNAALVDLNKAVDEHDAAVGGFDTGPLYIIATLMFLVISAVLFVKSRKKGDSEAAEKKRQIMKSLFKSSLWPTIGGLISSLWYLFSTDGSTLEMFGPVLIGGFYFFREVGMYFKEHRKELNQTLKAERAA